VVASLSLVPNSNWAAVAVVGAILATLLILTLFFYGYRRALVLINPDAQLGFIVSRANRDLQLWARRAKRAEPLLSTAEKKGLRDSTHDLPRVAFFNANPHWTAVARETIAHAGSFARRYSEQADYEVSGMALNSVIAINKQYVLTKGKTFFANNPFFDIPQANDVFITETLELLRRMVQSATARRDEEAIRQVLSAFSSLSRPTRLLTTETYMSVKNKMHNSLLLTSQAQQRLLCRLVCPMW